MLPSAPPGPRTCHTEVAHLFRIFLQRHPAFENGLGVPAPRGRHAPRPLLGPSDMRPDATIRHYVHVASLSPRRGHSPRPQFDPERMPACGHARKYCAFPTDTLLDGDSQFAVRLLGTTP